MDERKLSIVQSWTKQRCLFQLPPNIFIVVQKFIIVLHLTVFLSLELHASEHHSQDYEPAQKD